MSMRLKSPIDNYKLINMNNIFFTRKAFHVRSLWMIMLEKDREGEFSTIF